MDFAKVLDVHLVGTFYCCKAVWDGMRERNYGRIVLTTSSSGLFGNFGQANYGAGESRHDRLDERAGRRRPQEQRFAVKHDFADGGKTGA